ncbi:MAG TPA: hypothetical protein VFD36_20720, partial [Kofleriaceae bacterium]|nr:hypothetical protein [Kofleriaceae bacterium]
SYDLFWSEEGQGDDDIFGFRAFDSMKWKRFVRRVARFLEFVDDRRGATAGLTEDKLQAQYEYAENKAAMFAELARKTLGELQLRIDARYRGAS